MMMMPEILTMDGKTMEILKIQYLTLAILETSIFNFFY